MKRFMSLALALILTMALTVPAFASSQEMTVEQACEYVALSFMQNSLSNSIEIDATTPFYDLENNVTAYHISFTNNDRPSGYVLISLINPDNPIVEFSFDGAGLVATITEKQGTSAMYSSTPNNIYFLGAGNLYVGDSNAVVQNAYDGENYIADELNEIYQETMAAIPSLQNDVIIANGILNWADSNIDSSSIVKITDFGVGTDYWLMDEFSDGNVCSPTCATNVLWYWGVQRGYNWVVKNGTKSGKDLADDIFKTMSSKMVTVPSLGTLNAFIKGAYTDFIKAKGSNYTVTALTDNTYSDFTDAVDADHPVHTMLRNPSLFSTGHDVMTLGYGESTTGKDYLFVMDGWYDYGRFVDFNYFPIVKGIEVSVGKTAK